MNVEVESLPNCLASLKVEIPSEKVASTQSRIAAGYKNQARIPGYRPGKAPQSVIDKKFQKEIKEELPFRGGRGWRTRLFVGRGLRVGPF